MGFPAGLLELVNIELPKPPRSAVVNVPDPIPVSCPSPPESLAVE